MNKKRKKLAFNHKKPFAADLLPSQPLQQLEGSEEDWQAANVILHFRLCHHCMYLNESSSEVIACEKCKNPLTLEPMLAEGDPEQWGWVREDTDFDPNSEQDADAATASNSVFSQRRRGRGGLTGLSVFW